MVITQNLSWTAGQTAIIANTGDQKFEATVFEYTGSTGDFIVSSSTNTGTGTYNSWTINTGGAPTRS